MGIEHLLEPMVQSYVASADSILVQQKELLEHIQRLDAALSQCPTSPTLSPQVAPYLAKLNNSRARLLRLQETVVAIDARLTRLQERYGKA